MNMKITLIGLPLLLTSAVIQAEEITEVADPAKQQTRTELQTRMQAMSSEDRALYQQLNGSPEGNGNMNRKGDGKGSGDKKRHRKGSGNMADSGQSDGGYGSGYGSRNGGGRNRR